MQPGKNILDHLRVTHADFLHAKGEFATEWLIRMLELSGKERVLEIGFGTGATLVKLKSRYPDLQLFGIEPNPDMLAKTRQRIRFSGLADSIHLIPLHEKSNIAPASIDVIIIESVLAILDELQLNELILEIQKNLKPGGILALNESIWLESVSEKEIDSINQRCKELFGIIQCNNHFHGKKHVEQFFEQSGFQYIDCQEIDALSEINRKRKRMPERLSRIFTLFGKLKLIFNPQVRIANRNYNREMNKIFTPARQYLAGVLFLFQKK